MAAREIARDANRQEPEDERAAGRASERAQHAIFAERAKPTRPQAYQRHLKSRRWYHIRNAKLRDQKFTCQGCDVRLPRVGLDVHHERYPAVLGNEKLDDLRILCHDCHSEKHPSMINTRSCASIGSIVDSLFSQVP